QARTVLRIVQREVDRGSQETAGIAEVVAGTAVHHHVHRVPFLDQQAHGVGELEFTPAARGDSPQRVEDGAVQQVAAGRGERRRGLVGGRLLHHAVDLLDVSVTGVGDVEDAVGGDLLFRDVERAQHAAAVFGAHLRHPFQHASGQHEVVREQYGDRVVV